MLTSRGVRNATLAAMGIRPAASYVWQVRVNDLLAVQIVEEDRVRRFQAIVLDVHDHGHYEDVEYREDDSQQRGMIRVWRDGPRDGVEEVRIIRRGEPAVLTGRREREPHARVAEGEERERMPGRCPQCGKSGWMSREKSGVCVYCYMTSKGAER